MKKLITLLTVCSLSVLSQAWADVKLPKGSFTTDRLEEALKTALKQGKYYPKLVLTDTDGGRAQCFTYEAYKADSKKTSREIKKQIIALSKKEG